MRIGQYFWDLKAWRSSETSVKLLDGVWSQNGVS